MTTPIPGPPPRRRGRAAPVVGVLASLALAIVASGCLPAWPTGSTITVTGATPTTIDLSWPDVGLDADATLTSFEISLDGVVHATVDGTARSVHLTDLAPATTYRATVRALDSKGQWSDPGLTGDVSTTAATTTITERRTITWDGLTRSYRLDIPAAYRGSEGAPLVVGLHGGLSSGDGFAGYTRLPATAAAEGFVAVYPDGVAGPQGFRSWNGGGCCGTAQTGGVDDVGFVVAVVEELRDRFSVPVVALTGHSNGAILAYRIACERADAVDGVGIWAGTVFVTPCSPSRAVSVLHLHGLADTNLPFEGGAGTGVSGATFPPAADGIERFRLADGCGAAPVTTTTGVVTTSTWACAPGASLRLVTVGGANHEWAGGVDTPLAGTPSTALDATAAIAAFVDSL